MSEIVCSVWTEGRFVWKQCWVLKYSSSCGRGNCHTRNILRARQECEDSSRPSGTPAPGRNHSPGSGSNMCHSRWLLACEQPLLFGRAPRERASEGQSREGPPTPLPPRSRLPLACLSHVYFKRYSQMESLLAGYNPGQNVWDTLRFRWGKCTSSWPPSPLNSVGCYKSNTF